MTKKEIIKILNSNVRRLRRELKSSRLRDRERLELRLEEAERIRDIIIQQNALDRRAIKLERLL